MTPTVDTAAIEARANAATPGPWKKRWDGNTLLVESVHNDHWRELICETGDSSDHTDNTVFIAHAREDVPALLAHIRELQEAMRWRRVEEELPGNDETMDLVVYVELSDGTGQQARRIGWFDGVVWQYDIWEGYSIARATVTHWKPRVALPDLPLQEPQQ